ncbi:hypothetical protein CYLTODRAFT_467704 [Cylindrobasidium torrendii FP15055 ss-10]|uniref:F-box domain-containing protein n=1 Tax=Cylindrobasidium torrendii FP15055 ss-10 TaxID=1314674 RepID=A0A0D7B5A9_9AGAR|nr:hypothetical protein CYLTODRAFT_467704 [Cylindrobasidium torrendii FP15055 ss-10]
MDTAEAFLNHPALLARTEDVTFCGITGVSESDFRRATTAIHSVLRQNRLCRITLLRCTQPDVLSFNPTFIHSFQSAYFIDSALPLSVILGLMHKEWDVLYFCDAAWPAHGNTIRATVRGLSARTLWIEPFVDFCVGARNGGLGRVASRLLCNVKCLTLVDPNLSLGNPLACNRLSSIISPQLSHLLIASTCCFNHEEHTTPFEWTDLNLRSITSLTRLWLVLGSDDLEGVKAIFAGGLPAGLKHLRIEVHPECWDVERVQLLWMEVIRHGNMEPRLFTFSVCLCRSAGIALDFDEGSGCASVDADGLERIESAEEEWRSSGVGATLIRTEHTIQGFTHVSGRQWEHGQSSCMACADRQEVVR